MAHIANIAYGFDSHASSNAPGFKYPGSTLNPAQEYLLLTLIQPREYRFKQLYAGVDIGQFNGGGLAYAVLRFYDGIPSLPLVQTNSAIPAQLNTGRLVLEIPMGLCTGGTNKNVFSRAGHINFATQAPFPVSNFFNWEDGTGGQDCCSVALELDIVCDQMALFVSFDSNQWGSGPKACLISRGFNRPQRMYHEYNFESYCL